MTSTCARSRHGRLLTAIVSCVTAWLAQPSAWGLEGHHVIAVLAERRLTPAARQAVANLLGDTGFVAASTWADDVRADHPETSNWHFVNIPVRETRYVAARDCRPSDRGDCVVEELRRTQAVLRDRTAGRAAKAEALKFAIHFVSDLHQPLHAIDNVDRGGNDTRFFAADGSVSSLHALWDSGLIEARGLDETAYVARLARDLELHPIDPGPVDVVAWAEDSHRTALEAAYGFAEFTPGSPPAAPIRLTPDYLARASRIVDRQLQLAAVHLAAFLNDAFRS